MKSCSKCGEVKSISCFGKLKEAKDGLKYQCKSCIKKYRIENKESISKWQKEYRKTQQKRKKRIRQRIQAKK